ncbi:polysaccharide pyruvyl transferase family protein [Winogradskyella sp.]|uniref:polysaccharide pyruvyl transferase family protein n=1 Tax=Winogradskyella sp. TaxID=1883156 RepID=UPI003F6ACE41
MGIRTYYWDQRNVSNYTYFKNKLMYKKKEFFKYGNAGDMFNVDLIKKIYNEDIENVKGEGNRILFVGSVMNRVKEGDIINGIGWKGNDLSSKKELLSNLKVYGVRGPLTREFFEKYNTDLSNLKFEYDPGLLIKEVYNIDISKSSNKQIIFIPHFRDEAVYKKKYPKDIKHVTIDTSPLKLASEILRSEVVYSSSLHGIIFSHALGKPSIFVKPQSNEPIFKFRDYYLSVGLNMPEPLDDINQINFLRDKPSILSCSVSMKDFYFPTIKELKIKEIAY